MHGHTLTTFPGRPEDTLFPRPEEFHCEVFTDLLEKLLAVFCEQEMTMGEVAVKLDSLILMGKKKMGSQCCRGQGPQSHSGHNYHNEL